MVEVNQRANAVIVAEEDEDWDSGNDRLDLLSVALPKFGSSHKLVIALLFLLVLFINMRELSLKPST